MTTTAARTLHLIKHARSVPDPTRPACEWSLDPTGEAAVPRLARRLDPRPDLVFSSEEPKAQATARLLAETLDVPWRTAPDLHEHGRRTAPFLPTEEDFREAVRGLFERPDDTHFGEETGRQARERFTRAVQDVMNATTGTVAIVAHGTVIALMAAHENGRDSFSLWSSLGFSEHRTLNWPERTLRER